MEPLPSWSRRVGVFRARNPRRSYAEGRESLQMFAVTAWYTKRQA
jgi:hypothetical protein